MGVDSTARPVAAKPGVLSIQVESDSAPISLILRMILSQKSATFRDHALMRYRGLDRTTEEQMLDGRIFEQCLGTAGHAGAAQLEDDPVVGNLQSASGILFD